MYLAVDVGGTKTLLAVFDKDGNIIIEHKFDTNKTYQGFLDDLRSEIAHINHHDITHCCVALPARIDRKNGIGLNFGNLDWVNTPVASDLSQILGDIPVYVENDAKLAGLSEALLNTTYKRVLYLTISTGIGGGYIVNGEIDPSIMDMEPGQMLLEHDGRLQKWESFASGEALKEKYGRVAADIDELEIWQDFTNNLAIGLIELLAIIQPEVVIIGGGVGAHFNKYGKLLNEQIANIANPMISTAPIIQAKHPEQAVIYGCFSYIHQQIHHA